MPVLYNHGLHFYASSYAAHNPQKCRDMQQYGSLYTLRALPCTTPDDIIQIDPRLSEEYTFMGTHLADMGISVTNKVEWSISCEVANRFPDCRFSTYMFDLSAHAVRPDIRRLRAVDKYNNKNIFIDFCQKNGYPAPKTITVNDGRLPNQHNLNFPVYVKAAYSSSGVSIFRCTNRAQLKASIQKVGPIYQIQEEVTDILAFISVQYWGEDGTATHIATTEQILNGFSHVGNHYPSVHDPRDTTDKLARHMAKDGLKEYFCIDIAVTSHGIQLIECNPRWNGSAYPIIVANRLGMNEWTAYNLPTRIRRIRDIRLGDLEWNPKRGYGIVILNCGFLSSRGKINILIGGSARMRQELYNELTKLVAQPKHSRQQHTNLSVR